jgi:hypothetical protein
VRSLAAHKSELVRAMTPSIHPLSTGGLNVVVAVAGRTSDPPNADAKDSGTSIVRPTVSVMRSSCCIDAVVSRVDVDDDAVECRQPWHPANVSMGCDG